MKKLFEMIEAMLRGEYDMRWEKIISVSGAIASTADDVREELEAVNPEFAEFLVEGLYDISEDYDDGTPEEIEAYTRRVRELYEKAKAMM